MRSGEPLLATQSRLKILDKTWLALASHTGLACLAQDKGLLSLPLYLVRITIFLAEQAPLCLGQQDMTVAGSLG